jgi:hypothetical protein
MRWITLLAVLASGVSTTARADEPRDSIVVSLGLAYAPAPWMMWEHDRHEPWEHIHLLDQIGPRISVQWATNDYVLMGCQLGTMHNEGAFLLDVAYRIELLLSLREDLDLFFPGTAGISYWKTDADDHFLPYLEMEYWSILELGLGVGIGYQVSRHVGIHAEVSGTAAVYTAFAEVNDARKQFMQTYGLVRLLLVAGTSFSW